MDLPEYYQIVNKALKGDKEAQKKWGECQAEMIPKHIEAHSGGKVAKAKAEKEAKEKVEKEAKAKEKEAKAKADKEAKAKAKADKKAKEKAEKEK